MNVFRIPDDELEEILNEEPPPEEDESAEASEDGK